MPIVPPLASLLKQGHSSMSKPAKNEKGVSPQDDHPRREEILKVAVRLFSEKGYRGTRLNDVADTLGITRAALYYYFKNKEQLLVEMVREAGNQLTQNLKKILEEGSDDPVEKLRKVNNRAAGAFHRLPRRIRGTSERTSRRRHTRRASLYPKRNLSA